MSEMSSTRDQLDDMQPKWIATYGKVNRFGTPDYRAEHFTAANVEDAHKVAMSKIQDRDEYLYEIRRRKTS